MSTPRVKDNDEKPEDEFLDNYDDFDECSNCGGTGFVYMCVSEYACINPEDGCDLCERRCDWCQPARLAALSQEV